MDWKVWAIFQTISEPVLLNNHNKPKNNNSSSQTAILFLAFNDQTLSWPFLASSMCQEFHSYQTFISAAICSSITKRRPVCVLSEEIVHFNSSVWQKDLNETNLDWTNCPSHSTFYKHFNKDDARDMLYMLLGYI